LIGSGVSRASIAGFVSGALRSKGGMDLRGENTDFWRL
jgi:hypothetical protein